MQRTPTVHPFCNLDAIAACHSGGIRLRVGWLQAERYTAVLFTLGIALMLSPFKRAGRAFLE